MPTGRPAPRDLARVASAFGKGELQWVRPASQDRLVAAAAAQSHLSMRVQARMWARGWKRSQLAREAGMSPDRLGRILRGEQWLDVADAVAVGEAVGLDLLAVPVLGAPGSASAWVPASSFGG